MHFLNALTISATMFRNLIYEVEIKSKSSYVIESGMARSLVSGKCILGMRCCMRGLCDWLRVEDYNLCLIY